MVDPTPTDQVRMRKMARGCAFKWSTDDREACAQDLEQAGWVGWLTARELQYRWGDAYRAMLHECWRWRYGDQYRGAINGKKIDWEQRPRVTANPGPLDRQRAADDVEHTVACRQAVEKIGQALRARSSRPRGIDTVYRVWAAMGGQGSPNLQHAVVVHLGLSTAGIAKAKQRLRAAARDVWSTKIDREVWHVECD